MLVNIRRYFMVAYIENKKNLSSELGRMQAIDFAKSMINRKKIIELKTSKYLFSMLSPPL